MTARLTESELVELMGQFICTADGSDCWIWRARVSRYGDAVFGRGSKSYSVRYYLRRSHEPRADGGSFRRYETTCSTGPRCVNPDHLIPIGDVPWSRMPKAAE